MAKVAIYPSAIYKASGAADPDLTGYDFTYNSINEWDIARRALNLAGTVEEVDIIGEWGIPFNTTQIVSNNWTADDIIIKAIGKSRWNSVFTENNFIIDLGGTDTKGLYVRAPKVTIDGIVVKSVSPLNTAAYGLLTSSYEDVNVTVKNCLVYDCGIGINNIRSGSTITIINTISHSCYNAGIDITAGTAFLYNCTVFNCNLQLSSYRGGYRASSTCVVKNCVGYSNATADFYGTFNAASTNNAGALGTIPGANSVTLSSDPFRDTAIFDFRINDLSELYDVGVDLSLDGVTEDIIGVSRPQAVYFDIGAFEYDAGGAQGVPVDVYLRSVVEGSNCAIFAQADNTEILAPTLAPASGEVYMVYDYLVDVPVVVRVRKSSPGDVPRYLPYSATGVITATGLVDYVDQIVDLVVN